MQPLIEGVGLVELRQIVDARGAVLHMLRSDAADFTRFGECYFSEVLPGIVKGWKRHRAQTQNLAVVSGRMRLVVFDERETSPTRGAVAVFELGRPDAYARLRIPPGVWYAFGCVSASPALMVNCADLPHEPSDGDTRPLDDVRMPETW